MDPKLCNASPQGIGHAGEYGKIGFCRCGRFVSHEVNKPCQIDTETKEYLPKPDDCQCKAVSCPCGEFISHSVFDSCTEDGSDKPS